VRNGRVNGLHPAILPGGPRRHAFLTAFMLEAPCLCPMLASYGPRYACAHG
jgi:hypothetical protein